MQEVFKKYFTALFLSVFLWAKPVLAKDSVRCTQEQLRQKNCLLIKGAAKYQFLKGHLSIDDGVWKSVVEVPLENESSQWVSIKIFEKARRRFYELKIWTPPQEGVSLQSLNWLIVELDGIKTITHVNQVIQKRRPLKQGKNKFLKDKMEKHSLKVKGKKVIWSVGHLKGEF